MSRDDGVYRTKVTSTLDIEVDYSRLGADKEVRVPGRIFDHIDRRQPPSTWVNRANAALEEYNKGLSDSVRFDWWSERTVEDHGPGDVREVYTENWSVVVDGDIYEKDPINGTVDSGSP